MATLQCYLWKRARKSGSNWKRRWFTFQRETTGWTISYYKDEGTFSKQKPASGSVILSTNNLDARVTKCVSSKDYSIEVNAGDGDYPLIIAAEDSVRYNEIISSLGTEFVHATFSGWLYKRARKSGRNWKKRWMEVDFVDSTLRIYDDLASAQKVNKKGAIGNANDIITISKKSTVQASGLRLFCLELQPKEMDLSLFVAAENEEDYQSWKAIFLQMIAGTGTDGSGSGAGESKEEGTTTTVVVEKGPPPPPTPAAALEELKKSLSKKGSALFSEAVGHAASTTTMQHPPRRAPPAAKQSAAPPRSGRGPPVRRTGPGATPRAGATVGARATPRAAPPSARGGAPPARRTPGRGPAPSRRGPPPRGRAAPPRRRSTPNAAAAAGGDEKKNDDDDSDDWDADEKDEE